MDTQNLKAFLLVAETGSFSLAAQKLHLTQPAVSKRVAQLEEQLNASLFDRIGSSGKQMSRPASDFCPCGQQQCGTLLDRFVFIDNQMMHRKPVPHAETIAVHAHAERAVEAEQLRTRRIVAHAAFGTCIVRAVEAISLP